MAAGAVLIVAAGVFIVIRTRKRLPPTPPPISIEGAVLQQDTDPRKQVPLENAEVRVTGGTSIAETKSDASGLFRLQLRPGVEAGQTITVRITHQNYRPYELTEQPNSELLIARLDPILGRPSETPTHAAMTIKDVAVRYTVKVQSTINTGYAAKTFIAQNLGDVACEGQPPCSPDGKWKATTHSLSLDAGEGNEFTNARVSCIAGPCPFTRVDAGQIDRPSRYIKVSATSWSDTATFLVEAEVIHTRNANLVRLSYPVIFGQGMNFTLPSGAEGPSIEATLNGEDIVFPLGPQLILSWASCTVEVSPDRTQIYRCELKPGYRFEAPASGQ
jgi:hypothetical protein